MNSFPPSFSLATSGNVYGHIITVVNENNINYYLSTMYTYNMFY